ncbi:hypothetical protein [Candidatus Magnetomonas plexicatena]|uniref:hypothetical protein n=1 Tax=Candidatus Magnetomonas plexicatena TaxID=2552947 RepID=UPI0011051413|nr:hypothetical protein E2O03_000065 [Nitrospirales bacterium LBB_01]
MGDPGGNLEITIKQFVEIGCVIIICATRTSGKTVKIVDSLKSDGYEVIWKKKSYDQESDSIRQLNNQKKAEEIVKEIETLI